MCINPNSLTCYCPACEDEKSTVNRMRNSYATIDSNSLVRWMNSKKWIKCVDDPKVRGLVVFTGLRFGHPVPSTFNAISGEINAR